MSASSQTTRCRICGGLAEPREWHQRGDGLTIAMDDMCEGCFWSELFRQLHELGRMANDGIRAKVQHLAIVTPYRSFAR